VAATPEPGAGVIEPIARAIRDDRVTALAGVLAQIASSGVFCDPNFFSPPRSDRYARRLLWRDPDERFVIVAMTWAPGQGAPLHDHGGLWGAEVVVDGVMREKNYRVIERDRAGGARFAREPDTILQERAVGIVLPPLEYHSYENAGTTVSRTVHVYAGMFEECVAFAPAIDDWWHGERRTLTYDA
jgi:predicted metal-dependent enzyme (double-stranded beta helix superfamily)